MTPHGGSGVVLAQGWYEYRCDDHIAPVSETWQLRQAHDGYEIFSARMVPSQSLVISAQAKLVNGTLAHCLLKWCGQGGEECLATASYRRDQHGKSGAVYRVRRAGHVASSTLVGRRHYFPLLRIFSGQLFGGLAAEGGRAEVLVPWIQDPAQTDRLFAPDCSTRTLEYLGAERENDEGERVDRFLYRGGQYKNGAEYRLSDGLLVDYRWQQGGKVWQVLLKNFCGQWPGEKLWPDARTAAAPAGAANSEAGEAVSGVRFRPLSGPSGTGSGPGGKAHA